MTRNLFFALGLVMLPAASARADKLVLIAGGGNGVENVPALQAKLVDPFAVDFDKAGNMYLCELQGCRVLQVDPQGVLTILGGTGKKGDSGDGGPARQAAFNSPHSLAVGPDQMLYVADTLNHRVRKIDPKEGIVTAFAGKGKGYAGDDGPAVEAKFSGVYCIAFDPQGTKLLVTDLDNRRIRVIDMKSGTVHLVAGNGKRGVPADGAEAAKAPLVDPRAACFDHQGNIYILERSGHALRAVDPQGKIRTVIGTSGKAGNSGDGGDARMATMNGPKHLCVDPDDNVIIADTANHVIRRYSPKENKIVRIAGSGNKGDGGVGGDPLSVALDEPHGVYVSPAGVLYIADSMNHRVLRLEK